LPVDDLQVLAPGIAPVVELVMVLIAGSFSESIPSVARMRAIS